MPFVPAALVAAEGGKFTEQFSQAEADYREAKFAEALAGFEAVLASDHKGIDTAALHYNAGTSAHRSGRLGLAQYHYLRSLILRPFDSDVEANLALLEQELAKRVTRVSSDHWLRLERAPSWYLLASSLPLMLALAFSVVGISFLWAAAATALRSVAVLIFVGAIALNGDFSSRGVVKTAVVISEESSVRSGPGDQFPVIQSIAGGSSVRVRSEVPGWQKVSFAARGGAPTSGWIAQSDLRVL